MSAPPHPHWIDILTDKHECFGYSDTMTIPVEVNGRQVSLLLPAWLRDYGPLTSLRAVESDRLLFYSRPNVTSTSGCPHWISGRSQTLR